MTASFLPKPVTGVNGNGMHTNMSLTQQGQEPVLRHEGPGRAVEARAGTSSTASWPTRNDICLMLNSERQRLPPARPALRGAEPDQGLGDRPRLDGAHPARQREARRASRCARSRRTPTRTWRSTRCSAPASKGRSSEEDDDGKRHAHALPARQHLRRDPPLQGQPLRRRSCSARRCTSKFAELKLAAGRPLPEGAGRARSRPPRSSSTTR